MTTRSAECSTFVIERSLSAPIDRVFAAWSDAETKRRWQSCHDDWKTVEHALDFRVEGVEIHDVARPDGVVHAMRARYHDIVPGERIVYAYDLRVGDALVSVSLVTVTFARVAAKRTRMTFTEQVVLLDGHGDLDERREGTELGLDRLAAAAGGAA